jgi:hypothetical protein
MKIRVVLSLMIIAAAVIAMSGVVIADHTIPAGPESSGLIITTSADCTGTFQNHEGLAWQATNGNLSDNPPITGPGQAVNTVGYNENTIAVGGHTTYVKTFSVDTGNKTASESNLNSDKVVTYEATEPGGRMVSSEDVMVETVGNGGTGTAGPFGPTGTVPAENSRVTAGSTMDVTEVSAHTSATARTVSDSTASVELTYTIEAHGLNQTPGNETPAVGSATAYVDADIQTGNDNSTSLGTEASYHDVTSVDGLFELVKKVSYESGP